MESKSSDLDENTMRVIEHGKRLMEILRQDANKPLTLAQECIILYAINNKHLVDVAVEDIKRFEMQIYRFADNKHPELIELINKEQKLTDEVATALENMIVEFKKSEF